MVNDMALDLFQTIDKAGDKVGVDDLSSKLRELLLTTHAMGEEGGPY